MADPQDSFLSCMRVDRLPPEPRVGSPAILHEDHPGKGDCTYEYHMSALPSLVHLGIVQGILSNVFRKSDFVTNFEIIFDICEDRIRR